MNKTEYLIKDIATNRFFLIDNFDPCWDLDPTRADRHSEDEVNNILDSNSDRYEEDHEVYPFDGMLIQIVPVIFCVDLKQDQDE